MELTKWQEAVIDYLVAPAKTTDALSPRMINLSYGFRVNAGRRSGHTTLAHEILRRFPDACLVVPTEVEAKRVPAELRSRVFISSPEEANGKKAIMEKTPPVLGAANILVIDGASRVSEWELETFRAARWNKYVELEA